MVFNDQPYKVVHGEVNYAMAAEILDFLLAKRGQPVVIYLNTEGGDTHQAKEIVNIIRWHGQVTIVAFGECSSAGTLILCSAKRRYGTSECSYLIHFGEETANSAKELKENKRLYKWCRQVYESTLTTSKRSIARWVNNEKTLDPDEAVKWNLIEGVVL